MIIEVLANKQFTKPKFQLFNGTKTKVISRTCAMMLCDFYGMTVRYFDNLEKLHEYVKGHK